MIVKALQWHNDFIRNHYGIFPSWPDYIIAVFAKFDGLNDDSPSELVSLNQIASSAETYMESYMGKSEWMRNFICKQLVCDKEENELKYIEVDAKRGKRSFLEDEKVILALAMEKGVVGKADVINPKLDVITTNNSVEMENRIVLPDDKKYYPIE